MQICVFLFKLCFHERSGLVSGSFEFKSGERALEGASHDRVEINLRAHLLIDQSNILTEHLQQVLRETSAQTDSALQRMSDHLN